MRVLTEGRGTVPRKYRRAEKVQLILSYAGCLCYIQILKIKWIIANKKCCFYANERDCVPILTIIFPKYRLTIKLLYIGNAEKNPKVRKQSKTCPMRRLWGKSGHGPSLKVKLVHGLLIPV